MVEGVQMEWCTDPKPEWQKHSTNKRGDRKRRRERERERKSSYFTPMQHAEEIQLPYKLHD